MRKRIAVFLGEATGGFQENFTKSIMKHANAHNYDVFSFCVYGLYSDDYLYAEGEKASVYLPDFSLFDGVIITEDVFNIEGLKEELYSIIMDKAKCPVVYMRTEKDNCYSVLTSNEEAIESVTRHFIEHHGFRDICYMSGRQGTQDALERLQGFLNVMEEYNIPVTDNMIFHGDYWREKGKEAVDWFMQGRDSYPEAIICANDFMALSICEELKNRNVKIPEQVCVSGFDCVVEAKQNRPSLTTLEIDSDGMSKAAVEIIDAVNSGEEIVNKVVQVAPKLILQESCGCGCYNGDEQIAELMQQSYNTIVRMKQITTSTTEYQDAFEEDEYLWVAERYASLFRSNNAYLCLCDTNEEGYVAVENDGLFSKQMILKRIYHGDNPADKVSIPFDRKNLLPPEITNNECCNNYMVFIIHFKNRVYGYLAASIEENDWFDVFTQGSVMNLANAIENAAMQKKLADLEDIRNLYLRDALTGLYNRRGFDKQLRDQMDRFDRSSNSKCYAVSIDMDGLKYINDTFGHMEGDKALTHLAEALNKTMRSNEFCARNGGDEFSAFLCGEDGVRDKEFVKDFYDALAEANKLGLPYRIEASVGICAFGEGENDTLISCIQMADMRMYENKKQRKKKIKDK